MRATPWLWPLALLALLSWDRAAPALLPKLAGLSLLALLGAAWLGYRRAPVTGTAPLIAASLALLLGAASLLWGSPAGRLSQAVGVTTLCLAWVARGLWTTAELRAQLVLLARWLGAALGLWAVGAAVLGSGGAVHAGMGNPNWLGLCLAVTLSLSWPSRPLSWLRVWGFGEAQRALAQAPQQRTSRGDAAVRREALRRAPSKTKAAARATTKVTGSLPDDPGARASRSQREATQNDSSADIKDSYPDDVGAERRSGSPREGRAAPRPNLSVRIRSRRRSGSPREGRATAAPAAAPREPASARLSLFLADAASASQLVGLALAESRVAWVACGVAAAYALCRRVWGTRLPYLALVFAAAPGVASFGAAPALGDGALGALAGRRAIWHAATLAWQQAPLGVGAGDFSAAFLAAQGEWLAGFEVPTAARAFQHAETAHSDWLQAWVELGPLGGALLTAWLFLALRQGAWLRGVITLVTVGVCAIADNALALPAVAALTWLTTAALGDRRAERAGVSSRQLRGAALPARRLIARAAPWALLVLSALCLREATAAWRAERSATHGREHPETRLAAHERAARLYPSSPALALELGVARLSAGDAEGALKAATHSSQLSVSVASELLRAKVLSEQGRLTEALRALTSAAALSPGSFRVNLGLAAVALALGELDASQRALERARAVRPFAPELQPLSERLREAHTQRELH